MPKYTKDIPTLITLDVSNFDEIGRWVLDWNEVAYIESKHPPGLHVLAVRKWVKKPGTFNNPVYLSKEDMVYPQLPIAEYFETRCKPDKRLFPEDPKLKQETLDLCNTFFGKIGGPVVQYGYATLLPHGMLMRRVLTEGVSWWEKLVVYVGYPFLRGAIGRVVKLSDTTPEKSLEAVKAGFAMVEERLSDGRKYLMGDQFTIADITCASNAAPVLLPPQFGGNTETLEEAPPAMREVIEEFRKTKTGEFVMRIYEDHRPGKYPIHP